MSDNELRINGDFYLDIFSCKKFDRDIVIDYVKQYFSPFSVKEKYLLRQS